MTKAFFITEDEAPILRQIINDYRRRNRSMELQNSGGIFEDEPDEIFTPEVYIIEIPQADTNTGTGTEGGNTGTGTSSGGIPAMREEDGDYIPGKAECVVYKTWPRGEGDEEEELIKASVDETFKHWVHNISPTRITGTGINKFRIAWRDKYGRYFTQSPSVSLVELCSQEEAERNVPYQCLLGTWDPDLQLWCYDDAEEVWAIDHRKGAPHAQEGWKGLYQEMTSNDPAHDGKIYICVSLDCELPEEGCSCGGAGTGTGTGTGTGS